MRRLILRGYRPLKRMARDLSILIAWSIALTGVMLLMFYTRTCQGQLPCQSASDLSYFLFAALGAGLVLEDERMVVAGFMVAHFLSTVFFVTSLTAPALLGLTGPALSDAMVNLSVVIAFKFQFPFAVIVSLVGCVAGFFAGSRLNSSS